MTTNLVPKLIHEILNKLSSLSNSGSAYVHVCRFDDSTDVRDANHTKKPHPIFLKPKPESARWGLSTDEFATLKRNLYKHYYPNEPAPVQQSFDFSSVTEKQGNSTDRTSGRKDE